MSTSAPAHEAVELPRSAPPAARAPLPLLTAIVPVVGAVVLWAVTGSAYALLFAVLGPLIALASVADAARSSRRARRKDGASMSRRLDAARVEISRRHQAERDERWSLHPDVARYLSRPEAIWRPVPERDGMLVVGSGDDDSVLRVNGGDGDDDATDLRRRSARIEDVPILVPIGVGVAVVGPLPLAAAVSRALAVQVLLSRPPGEVRLDDDAPAWADAAPHRAAPSGALLRLLERGGLVGGDADIPIVAVPDGAPPPPRCGAVLRLTGPAVGVLDVGGRRRTLSIDALSTAQATQISHMLTERADRALGGSTTAARSLRDLVEASVAGTGSGLDAVFSSASGEPFAVDLVADGPHAVVVGMTGAGKSELLTSWIVALSSRHAPAQVAFLLVDFKGGRTFDHLEPLPHVTGVLTDLDEPAALRAIKSLRAEVRHRERRLADLGARDVAEAAGALGRLVIVVDEYAALVAAHPALHDVFADLAARGRALGIHLILAAQRATGVFRDAVLANAPLRIALRVADGSDSRAVLGVDDAARLSGRPEARGTALVRRSADTAPWVVRVARCDSAIVRDAAVRHAGDAARAPWLPALPPHIPLDAVREEGQLVLGIADEPEHQRQAPLRWPEGEGALAVVGGPGSGRTSVLRAIAAQTTAILVPPQPEHAWDALAGLDDVPAGTTVLVDDVDALLAALPGDHGAAAAAALERAIRGARTRGIRVVFASQRMTGGAARLADLASRRLILGTAARADHVAAGGEAADHLPDVPPGRGRYGRLLVQTPWTDAEETTALPPPPVWQPGRRPAAVVIPDGPRQRRLQTAWERLGVHVQAVGAGAALARGGVLIGAPDAWLGQWRLLAEARAEADLIVDTACAVEYRAVVGARELPPFALAGAGRAWVHAPDRPVRRVLLEAER
ncbi:cell division protein FtsK [Microbacterium sp. EYE_5]|uniref:FtsK/SpoIIIE domain-containing protein n=1 Tax=unclassified Microbacterium TaxID=2609290 RepID=UPI0020044545|nr:MULTISPECIES: FtsK/SpoIIIE domain-containing protein [unclassified Microbacterium]MCK6081391.1 cell division protein FtsK [Microbacterium sp. EYE_382]MCK6086661.1 cell division protein FtsK [Microbacterium sp. EYE_384]MCK6123841.1 cell division protein FtsK [Microbacterium sp. EYE_80]MCK6126750.1 cell division protein FtsK [Microbacterium sp. EYE_79]MCK6142346.1 cell division protein FtsK [Microbacterium sp. EYE_39]